MRLLTRLSWVAMALAALHCGVGVGLSFYGTEGWFGGIVYALLYALPLLLIGLALRSSRSWLHIAAGWAALVLAVYYSFIVVASWSGFSRDDVFMVCTTAPTVALDLVIFWATVLRRSRRFATTDPRPGGSGVVASSADPHWCLSSPALHKRIGRVRRFVPCPPKP